MEWQSKNGYDFPEPYPPECPSKKVGNKLFSSTDMKVQMATCCDADGFCYGDGNDAWCCNKGFYCTNDNPIRAAERGGIMCPINEAMFASKILNILGLAISVMFILLLCFFYWFKGNQKIKTVVINVEEDDQQPVAEMTNESSRKTPSDLRRENRRNKFLNA